MKEIWKDIEAYEGLYQVSNLGRVKSLPKEHRYGSKSEKILKPRTKKENDYARVSLCKDGKIKSFRRARLIAQTFITNPENKYSVNHINGIKSDDRVENLEWATASEQNYHMYKFGLKDLSYMNKVSFKGNKHTIEAKDKVSNANKGKTPWNKGMTKQEEYEYRINKKRNYEKSI
jgi:hypothetical protein